MQHRPDETPEQRHDREQLRRKYAERNARAKKVERTGPSTAIATLSSEEILDFFWKEAAPHGLLRLPAANERVVERNTDAWLWGVLYANDRIGSITWGERHDTRSPVGIFMELTNPGGVELRLRIELAVRLALVMQLVVEDTVTRDRYPLYPVIERA
jgi:hypothetical protein